MVLNRNPVNYFAEVEQSAFSPANFVPGIAASPDKMLQGRLFSYHDTHRHRLGVNYHQIPVNSAKGCPMSNYQRDGFTRVDDNGGAGPNYWPNSFGGPVPDQQANEPAFELSGTADRHEYVLSDIDFVQTGNLYHTVMTDKERSNLVNNIIGHLKNALPRIQKRQTAMFYKADADYGIRVAAGLGLDVREVERLASVSQEERVKATAA